jgi:hypothetical protein
MAAIREKLISILAGETPTATASDTTAAGREKTAAE